MPAIGSVLSYVKAHIDVWILFLSVPIVILSGVGLITIVNEMAKYSQSVTCITTDEWCNFNQGFAWMLLKTLPFTFPVFGILLLLKAFLFKDQTSTSEKKV